LDRLLICPTHDSHSSYRYAGFLPGLAYFSPAIPTRPVDRSASDAGFNHFVPTEFDVHIRALIASPLAGIAGAVPVTISEPLVDSGVVTAAKLGTAIPLINWAGKPLKGLTVTLNFDSPFKTASLARGGKLTVEHGEDGHMSFELDLELTDAIILRP